MTSNFDGKEHAVLDNKRREFQMLKFAETICWKALNWKSSLLLNLSENLLLGTVRKQLKKMEVNLSKNLLCAFLKLVMRFI